MRFMAMLSAMLNRKKGKKNIGTVILFAFLYIYLGIAFLFLFSTLFFTLGAVVLPMGQAWFYFSLMIILSFSMMLLGSVFITKSQLFEARDNELLLSMPIRPRDLLISRMLYLAIMNYAMAALVFLPATVVWMLFAKGSVWSWIALMLTYLTLPLFCLAISSLLAWLISLLSAKLPNKNLFTVVFSVGFLLVYFYFVSNSNAILTSFLENQEKLTEGLRSFAPLYWMGSAIGNGNVLHLLFALLIYTVPFALTCVILSRSFVHITTQKSGTSRKKDVKGNGLRANKIFFSLLGREFARLLSSASYLLNAGLSIPLALVMTVALVLKMKDLEALTALLPLSLGDCLGLIITVALIFLNGMALFTAPSISLEGKQFALLRSLPIPTKRILQAKLAMHLSLMLPTNLLCAVIVIIVASPSLTVVLMSVAVPCLFAVWCGNIGLICNLWHPMLEWTNEAQPVKQGIAVLLTMLFSTLLAIAVLVIGVLMFFIEPWLSFAAVTTVLLAADALSYVCLMKWGTQRFENIL